MWGKMKTIQITIYVDNTKFEDKIADLEKRCQNLEISLQDIYQIVVATMPCNPFIDILLSLSDLKIFDLEEEERNKNFWKKFKFHQKKEEK